jgi:hypothetical protein
MYQTATAVVQRAADEGGEVDLRTGQSDMDDLSSAEQWVPIARSGV